MCLFNNSFKVLFSSSFIDVDEVNKGVLDVDELDLDGIYGGASTFNCLGINGEAFRSKFFGDDLDVDELDVDWLYNRAFGFELFELVFCGDENIFDKFTPLFNKILLSLK